jgi:hypothetical protein
MNRFLNFLATFSLAETIGRHPAIAGTLMLLGVGGTATGVAMFTPPALTPFVSSNFNPNQPIGGTNNGLKPNGGTAGANQLPSGGSAAATNSFAIYFEATINASLAYAPSFEAAFNNFALNANTVPGQPNFFFQRTWNGSLPGSNWSLNPGTTFQSGGRATPGSNYATGFYPFTAPVSGCIRRPTGVWVGGGSILQQVDPGLGCPAATPTLNAAAIAVNIPGSGAQQSTSSTTCAVVGGLAQVTTHVSVAHGIYPGLTFALSGFTPSGFNTTSLTTGLYTALFGTSGTTLVGTTGATSCPAASASAEGSALSGSGGAINFPSVSTTNPFNFAPLGITAKNNQHFCALVGEYGDESPFPGAQFMAAVDEKGNPLPGSPSLIPFLNQGTSNFVGSTSGAVLTIAPGGMNPYTITGASYSGTTGYVTFTLNASPGSPGFVPGSEFTVSGLTNTGSTVNQTYVAVNPTGLSPASYQTSLTIWGNPISGPTGIPQAFTTAPSGIGLGATPQMVSVVLPGQILLQASPVEYIMPYGTLGTTGVGADGTYALSGTPTVIGSSTIFAYSGFYYSAATSGVPSSGAVTPRTAASIGDFFAVFGGNGVAISPPAKTGWGGSLGNIATLWGKIPTQTGSAPSTADLASICTKQTDIQAYAAAQTTAGNPLKVNSLYRLNDLGIWADSSDATITGYITNSSGTNATLNVVSTTLGSLALATGTQTAKLTGVGLPVASPVTIPLTTSAASTYAITANTTPALGSLGSPVTFAVGAFAPALPVQSNTIKGYIDTAAGVSTLHVTSLDDGTAHSGFARFTGTLGTSFTAKIDDGSGGAGNILTVTAPPGTAPTAAYIGVGTVVCPGVGSGAFACATVTALGTGLGLNGTYTVGGSAQLVTTQVMFGSGVLPGPATTLQATSVTGSISAGMVVTDGGASLTAAPLLIVGGVACPLSNCFTVAGNYYPPISGDATMQATLTTIIPGEYLQNAAITNPVKIVTDPSNGNGLSGTYKLSGSPNTVSTCGGVGCVGTSGSPVVITGTTITDGGAIAPGPALTIDDKGPGITYLVNFGTGLGSLTLSGTYDVSTLGGTPSGIQALVSNSANGPPLAGCTPCNWGALTGTISGGKWSGTLAGIPGGGPYFVSVRAANATSLYATLPNSIRVGWVSAGWGNGQLQSFFGNQTGANTSGFSGLWGFGKPQASVYASSSEGFIAGPPVTANFVPNQPVNYAGDRFGVAANGIPLPEAIAAFDQGILNSLGVPASILYPARDGVGMGPFTLGNVAQTQTVGSGDGSKTVWCSASKFCGNVDVGAPLVFNAASLTGVWFTGSVAGSTLTVTTRQGGALEPGMVLGATGSPTVLRCLTSCTTPLSIDGSTWALSSSSASGATGTLSSPLRADPPLSMIPFGGTTTPWPNFNIQTNGSTVYGFAGFGQPIVKAGTFKIIDTDPATGIGTTVCQDSQTFAYNQTGGDCSGTGISAFVNYQTGDYQVTFTTAPLAGHAINASWNNIVSPEVASSAFNRPQNLDTFGDGGEQSGYVSSQFSKYPGGVSAQMWISQGSDTNYMFNVLDPVRTGYEYGGIGYSQMISWLYDTKFPALIPGASASVSFFTDDIFRLEGPVTLYNTPGNAKDNVLGQWAQDSTTESTFSGTVLGSVLTLTSNAVGPMWEGEILGCVSYNATTCPIGPLSGAYITSLASGAWGVSGSTYNLSVSPGNLTNLPIQNPVYYSGPGSTLFLGTQNDVQEYWNSALAQTTVRAVHPGAGFTGGRRALTRWAAMIYGANGGNASDPKVDRVKANATGCDGAALAAPCFDIGTTYQASFSTATWSGNTVTISGGLAVHARPFVRGQAFSCSGCNTGLVIDSLSVPPTQSTVAGAGEVGQTFTFTVKNAAGQTIGGSGSGAVTAGCSGTSGAGSNCIDVAISINVSGTFGTAAALDTCGSNNLNGNAPNYTVAAGKCQGRGIGEIVRTFRAGTAQQMNGDGSVLPTAGSVFDDGIDLANGHFNQSAGFTANIVGAKVVQLVKAPAYSGGVLTGVGQWSSGSTYVSYGDGVVVSGRIASLLGYVGGQSFPFTAGSGYTNGTTQPTVTCSTLASGGAAPKFDVTVVGGAIVNVVPANAANATGLGVGSTCTVALPVCSGGGCGGAIPTISLAPVEGVGGIGTYNTDNNTMGMFLYDNSGFPGNPLNQFFTNGTGGYFEPGLPLRPFGMFQGAAVSG